MGMVMVMMDIIIICHKNDMVQYIQMFLYASISYIINNINGIKIIYNSWSNKLIIISSTLKLEKYI